MKRNVWKIGAYTLFWSWNLIFLAFMFLGFAPTVLPELLPAVQDGVVPGSFLVYGVILTLIPAVALLLGGTVLKGQPYKLLMLGYGVQGPLMLLLAIRFAAVRELSPALALLLIMGAIGLLTLLWQLLDTRIDTRRLLLTYLRVIGLTLLLLLGVYASVWIAFYAVPLAVQGIVNVGNLARELPAAFADIGRSLRDFDWREVTMMTARMATFTVLGFTLAMFSATLFVAMPLAVPVIYTVAWRRAWRTLRAQTGWVGAWSAAGATVAVLAVLFVGANRQPQHRAFALLADTPQSPAEAQALLEEEATIRSGLLNAYLSPFRYFSAVGEVHHVREMYRWGFDLTEERAAVVQSWYETVARPVLYTPIAQPGTVTTVRAADNRAQRTDSDEAALLYEQFFDRPISEAERAAVVRAARSTWSPDQAQAAWQAVDDREVHLLRQEVTVTEHGDWADVELYEVYQNQTQQRQEVVYYVSLPESAVITGVWLGSSADRDERFAYRVAPRGAAQATYRNEVRRQQDPALVEQIGPRQYRVRIFPIEPEQRIWSNESNVPEIEEGAPMHMWLTYRTLAQADGWPLPRLAELRNVYWDHDTERLMNGEPMAVDHEAWLPDVAPIGQDAQATRHLVAFPGGKSVLALPLADLPNADEVQVTAPRLAVVLDRSRSMSDVAVHVADALAQLAERTGGDADLYLTASQYRGEDPSVVALGELDPASILYFGGQNAAELLAQFAELRGDQSYDAVLVLTDGTGYELGSSEIAVPPLDVPVWMVHLGGELPLGYDDATLEVIQASGGGVTSSVDEAIMRLQAASLVAAPGGATLETVDIVDGYAWLTLSDGADVVAESARAADLDAAFHKPSEPFAAFAARRLILAEMQKNRGQLDDLETLDALHALAVNSSIVTPYSSMIVLVNTQQQQLLNQLEQMDDRFQREYEMVGETLPEDALTVTGVPEPHEWLLMALAAMLLVWYAWRTQRSPQGRTLLGA